MADHPPDRQAIEVMVCGHQAISIVGAAAELDLFTAIGNQALSVEELAAQIDADLRGLTILLDATAALGYLGKTAGRYTVPETLRPLLCADQPDNILPMIWHRMSLLRSWSMLAWTSKGGIPAPRPASIRGPAADNAAFIAAMHTISGPNADELIAQLAPSPFRHLLDVGGASGTWTLAFLRAVPGSSATIFDLPSAIEQARRRLAGTPFASRVNLVAGDFYVDELPGGADYAWVSAIAHQHSRVHNRALYAKVIRALTPGGTIGIRDMVMELDRTRPIAGALFAVNMLANTPSGNTFTFAEYAEDLVAVGFQEPRLAVQSDGMNSVVTAMRP